MLISEVGLAVGSEDLSLIGNSERDINLVRTMVKYDDMMPGLFFGNTNENQTLSDCWKSRETEERWIADPGGCCVDEKSYRNAQDIQKTAAIEAS